MASAGPSPNGSRRKEPRSSGCITRWEIGTAHDEVKTRILGPGAALRSKTPDLVFQETDELMLARYAVRRLTHEAAEKAGFPSCTPCVSCAAGSSVPAPSPPEDRPAGVIDEILEERVVSSRGQSRPRGVRQKMSGCPLRKRGPVSRRQHAWTPEIIPNCAKSNGIGLSHWHRPSTPTSLY